MMILKQIAFLALSVTLTISSPAGPGSISSTCEACVAGGTESHTSSPLSVQDGIGGVVEVDTYLLEEGKTQWVTSLLQIDAAGLIVINGELLGAELTPDAFKTQGVSITLRSQTRIEIRGLVRAGRGSDAVWDDSGMELTLAARCLVMGCRGGDVTLIAPEILIDGRVFGGDGGNSAPNGNAPAGGDVRIRGAVGCPRNWLAVLPADHGGDEYYSALMEILMAPGGFGVFAGNAGGFLDVPVQGAVPFHGRGGDGGRIEASVPKTDPFSLDQQARREERRDDLTLCFQCPDGLAGMEPLPSRGGAGSDGQPGRHGSQASPDGGTGAPGGHGGVAIGLSGGNGQDAPDCCPLPTGASKGGDGGAGSAGGGAVGGPGGAGGRGGNGYVDLATGITGQAGVGGSGGDGGGASGGHGGRGSRGGKPVGDGGVGGAGGVGVGGREGLGGAPGSGALPATPGPAGVEGDKTDGNNGPDGPKGAVCDS